MLAVMMVAALRVGWWFGHRQKTRYGDVTNSRWYGAVLPLLSLLVAFTVNTSLGKQNQRQQLVVADTNAIREFYNYTTMLNEPTKSSFRQLIREYTRLRIDLSDLLDQPSFDDALRRSDQIQAQMNELVGQVVMDGTPLAAVLIGAFGRIADSADARLAAAVDRLPATLVLLLMSAALISTLVVGREEGVSGRTHVAGAVGFIFLVSFSVYVALDLNQPGRGQIIVSQRPIERLLSSMPK